MKKTMFLSALLLSVLFCSQVRAEGEEQTCQNGTWVYENGVYVCQVEAEGETTYGELVQGQHPYELNSKAGK